MIQEARRELKCFSFILMIIILLCNLIQGAFSGVCSAEVFLACGITLQCWVQMFQSVLIFSACLCSDMDWMHPVTNEYSHILYLWNLPQCGSRRACAHSALSLTFPIDLSQIDRGSRCFGCHYIMRVQFTNWSETPHWHYSPNMNRHLKLWHWKQNAFEDDEGN